MIALLVMTDGRDHIFDTIPSAEANLDGSISERWIHDDSGSEAFAQRLYETFPGYSIVSTAGRSGFGGAIRSAWRALRAETSARFVFHLEDDFTFRRGVNLDDLAAVLDDRPQLCQLALRRQAWNPEEVAAGGVVEAAPEAFEEVRDELRDWSWLEHRRFFTTNPSLYRRELLDTEWPDGPHSEGMFSAQLFADPATVAGYWGDRNSGEWVHHIGERRAGVGY